MSRQFWVFLSQTNSEWNKIDYNRNVAWQEDILTESNDLSTKDCNGKTKKQITRSVRRLQSFFQITVTIFTLDYVNINFPSHYNRQNNPKSYPSLTLDYSLLWFTLDTLRLYLRKIISRVTCTRVTSEKFYMVMILTYIYLLCMVSAAWRGKVAVVLTGWSVIVIIRFFSINTWSISTNDFIYNATFQQMLNEHHKLFSNLQWNI